MWKMLPSLAEKVWEQMRQWLGREEGSRREKSQLCIGCWVRSGEGNMDRGQRGEREGQSSQQGGDGL